jgi:predicted acylesterase/phospholipase RssA
MTSWSLSFSGAGHLLSYHLGVAKTLSQKHKIRAVAGSSSGAIVAAALTLFSHEDFLKFTSRYLKDGGYALTNFQKVLSKQDPSLLSQKNILLGIATTDCADGSLRLFSFDPSRQSTPNNQEFIATAVRASCTIPLSFHPWDVFTKLPIKYPGEQDGVEIDGRWYCDGGIAGPAPFISIPKNSDQDKEVITKVLISPISGSSTGASWSIRPRDGSVAVPSALFGDLTTRCGTFGVRPSVQNLHALIASAGIASPQLLQDWHDRGVDDTLRFLDEWNKHHKDTQF